jgi:hypothetical protein
VLGGVEGESVRENRKFKTGIGAQNIILELVVFILKVQAENVTLLKIKGY